MNFRRIYAIFLRQVYLVKDNGTRFGQIFIWTALDIALWGFISKYLNGVTDSGFSFLPLFLGAVLLWDFLTQVMQGVTVPFFEDVWARNFLNIFASPLRVSEYVSGLVLTGIVRSIIALVTMLILASLAFGFSLFIFGASLALFLMILFLFGIALGILGLSIVLRFGPPAEWFIWPIPALLGPFVGVFYPISILPQWMQYIGQALPPSYVFAGIRSLIAGGELSVPNLILGIVLSIGYIILAYWVFKTVYRKAIRTGLIARYSAETVV